MHIYISIYRHIPTHRHIYIKQGYLNGRERHNPDVFRKAVPKPPDFCCCCHPSDGVNSYNQQLWGHTDRLKDWDGKDCTCPGTTRKRGCRRPCLFLVLGRLSSDTNWIPKIQQRWGDGTNAGIVYRLGFWLKRITFVHIPTLYNTKHCLEIQLLSETRRSANLLHTLISCVIMSKSFYSPAPQLPVCKLREKTGFPLFCHCLP